MGRCPREWERGRRLLHASVCRIPGGEPPLSCARVIAGDLLAVETKVCMLNLAVQEWWPMHCRGLG